MDLPICPEARPTKPIGKIKKEDCAITDDDGFPRSLVSVDRQGGEGRRTYQKAG